MAIDPSQVRQDLYQEWGDIAAFRSFDAWWREVGIRVITLEPDAITAVSEGEATDGFYLLRVPKSLTSTEIGNQVRQYLIGLGHQPRRLSTLRIAEGREIRPRSYRAYLHTLDQHQRLQSLSTDEKVKGRDLLVAVRKFYLDRERRYRNSVKQVDKLPAALIEGMNRENLNEVDVLANTTAINTVARYLREANKIIDAVRVGRFPS
jgi:Ni,Fe-hydrogenase maturation factor